MGTHKNAQEEFWAGKFGDEYIERNVGDAIVAVNLSFFSSVLRRAGKISSVMEFGANVGMNLLALKSLLPAAKFAAVEINAAAVKRLKQLAFTDVSHTSILDFVPAAKHDLVLAKTVLIHIAPEFLPTVYDRLYETSSRYICLAEYYSPTPVDVPYRGHSEKLFKRDFAGEMLDRFPGLRLVDYGFVYQRDPNFPVDDITWFLLEKAPS